jgi:hypothetical protein
MDLSFFIFEVGDPMMMRVQVDELICIFCVVLGQSKTVSWCAFF